MRKYTNLYGWLPWTTLHNGTCKLHTGDFLLLSQLDIYVSDPTAFLQPDHGVKLKVMKCDITFVQQMLYWSFGLEIRLKIKLEIRLKIELLFSIVIGCQVVRSNLQKFHFRKWSTHLSTYYVHCWALFCLLVEIITVTHK